MTKDTTPSAITVSLEWAKKLKEAGWPQDSIFFWYHNPDAPISGQPRVMHRELVDLTGGNGYAAPTAEEILRRLPRRLEGETEGKWICINSHADRVGWKIGYLEHPYRFLATRPTLADTAAEIYCYLAKHKLLPSSND